MRKPRSETTDDTPPRDLTPEGIGALLFATDYPHSEGTFPFSRDVVDRMMAQHPDATIEEFVAVLGGNAARRTHLHGDDKFTGR